MKRYFITHIVPREEITKYKTSTAGYNFCESLLKQGVFDESFSILPTNIFHYVGDMSSLFQIVRPICRWNSSLFTNFSCLLEQILVFFKIKSNSTVWFYNLTQVSVLLYCLLRIFKPSVKLFIIILDFTPEDPKNKIFLPLINKSDGIIKLADSERFTNGNSICMPGVVDIEQEYSDIDNPTNDFLLCGNIKEPISMISKILRVFQQLPDCNLHISGMAEDSAMVKAIAEKYDNIHYYGLTSFDKYKDLMDKCTFLLSTRDPESPRNQCNFPSKIMEGLLHNKIILSTISYEQLNDINYLLISPEESKMKEDLRRIIGMPNEELLKYANQSQKAKSLFNAKRWSELMNTIENNVRK